MPLRQGETIPQMVTRIAREQGLDARATKIALAIVAQESRFNPQAEGDWSAEKNRMRSIGLFQLNEEGLGAGMGDTRYDPEANANRGIKNLKAVYDKYGNETDGRIAYLSQRPANEAEYTNSINAKTSGRDQQWAGTIDSAMRGAGGQGVFPLAGQTMANTTVTTEFGAKGSNAGYSGVPEEHRGVDLSAKRGTAVLSPVAGTVTTAHQWTGNKDDPYGNWIEVKGDDGKSYRFAHLQDLNVKQGATVGGGQTIATVDSTGNSTGDHLHFEEIVNGQPVNPRNDLAGTQSGSGGTGMADNSQATALVTALEQQRTVQEQKVRTAQAEVDRRQFAKDFNQQEIDRINKIPAGKRSKEDQAKVASTGADSLILKNDLLDADMKAPQARVDEQDKTLREIDVQLATARKMAAGDQLDPSQRAQNDAQAEQARANAQKIESDVQQSKDPNSPDNVLKLQQAALYRKQADNYDKITAADNAQKAGQTASAYASANASNAQAEATRGTLESTIKQHLAAAGLDEAHTKEVLASMGPTIDKIIADTAFVKDNAAYIRAQTKVVNDTLPATINKLVADGRLTTLQGDGLLAKLPGDLVLQGTQARLDQANAENARASGISSLATANKTQYDMQMDAWKAQHTQGLAKLAADPNTTSDQLSGFLMSAATNATEMVNAFRAQVEKSTNEETARHQKTQEGIDVQRADEEMRNNLAGNITNYMNARTNQQNASTTAMGPMLGSVRDFNALSAMGPLAGAGDAGIEGIKSIAANMGVGEGVLNGVLSGLKDYQGTVKGFKDQMPNVRMANTNVATPNFISPGVMQGVAKGSAGAAALPPPPAAPNLNLPTSVPSDAPAIVPPPTPATTTPVQAGNTPPDQMDNPGNDLPQQPTDAQVEEQKKEDEDSGGGGGRGGGGGAFAFTAPKGHGKKVSKPSRAARAMGAFTPPLGRAA